jgi:hypothetical protein
MVTVESGTAAQPILSCMMHEGTIVSDWTLDAPGNSASRYGFLFVIITIEYYIRCVSYTHADEPWGRFASPGPYVIALVVIRREVRRAASDV